MGTVMILTVGLFLRIFLWVLVLDGDDRIFFTFCCVFHCQQAFVTHQVSTSRKISISIFLFLSISNFIDRLSFPI